METTKKKNKFDDSVEIGREKRDPLKEKLEILGREWIEISYVGAGYQNLKIPIGRKAFHNTAEKRINGKSHDSMGLTWLIIDRLTRAGKLFDVRIIKGGDTQTYYKMPSDLIKKNKEGLYDRNKTIETVLAFLQTRALLLISEDQKHFSILPGRFITEQDINIVAITSKTKKIWNKTKTKKVEKAWNRTRVNINISRFPPIIPFEGKTKRGLLWNESYDDIIAAIRKEINK